MEYAKDEVFSIRYNPKKDKLEYGKIRRLIECIRRNKFLTLLMTLGILFSGMNFILIYYFFDILNTI